VVNGIDVDRNDNSYVVGNYSDSLYIDTFAVRANLINTLSNNHGNNGNPAQMGVYIFAFAGRRKGREIFINWDCEFDCCQLSVQ